MSRALFAVLLLTSCSLVTVNRPVINREYQRRQRREDAQFKRSIPFSFIVRQDCKAPLPKNAIGEHWQWLGWRYGWRRVPDVILIGCLTPEEYRKMCAPVEGAKCHP